LYETDEDLRRLQARLDTSHVGMGVHMRSILTPDKRLTARQVVAHLQGIRHVALATVTARGEPRVAPLDALFIRGRFHLGTGGAATRLRHIEQRPAVSLTYFAGDEVAVTAHGWATRLPRGHPDVPALEVIYVALYGSSPFGWAPDVTLIRVEPTTMYAYAPRPDRFPERPTTPEIPLTGPAPA